MAWFFVLIWIVGGSAAAVLSLVVASDNARVVALGRRTFALVLAADLLFVAAVFSLAETSGNGVLTATRSIWWLTAVAGGIPLALVSGFGVRRGYPGRRLELTLAVLMTAALYLAFPLGFIPGQPLTGLGLWEHEHHALDIVILLIPCLILLSAEVLRHSEPTDDPSPVALLRRVPRRTMVGVAIVVLILVWFAGVSPAVEALSIGVLIVAGAVVVGIKNRVAVRRVRRDISS